MKHAYPAPFLSYAHPSLIALTMIKQSLEAPHLHTSDKDTHLITFLILYPKPAITLLLCMDSNTNNPQAISLSLSLVEVLHSKSK